jgi:hypothetical protein
MRPVIIGRNDIRAVVLSLGTASIDSLTRRQTGALHDKPLTVIGRAAGCYSGVWSPGQIDYAVAFPVHAWSSSSQCQRSARARRAVPGRRGASGGRPQVLAPAGTAPFLIGPGRGIRATPRSSIGVFLRIGGLRQGAVHLLSLPRQRQPIDDRAHQRMAKSHPSAELDEIRLVRRCRRRPHPSAIAPSMRRAPSVSTCAHADHDRRDRSSRPTAAPDTPPTPTGADPRPALPSSNTSRRGPRYVRVRRNSNNTPSTWAGI